MNENKDIVEVDFPEKTEEAPQIEAPNKKEREVSFRKIADGKSFIKVVQANGTYRNFETRNTAGLKFQLGILPKPTSSGGASKRKTSRRK